MTNDAVLWTILAVLLFWVVGAYNRLVRLRAEANTAFGTLEAEYALQVELVRTQLPPPDATQPMPLDGGQPLFTALHAAAAQFAATLAATRAKPLDRDGIATLSAAHGVLAQAWERAERDDAHDLAGPQLPEQVTARRAQLAMQGVAAAENFNKAVLRYNEAIAQFPAVVLALLFGFKPGRAVESTLITRLH